MCIMKQLIERPRKFVVTDARGKLRTESNSLASYSYSYLMDEYNIAQNMKYNKEVQDKQW